MRKQDADQSYRCSMPSRTRSLVTDECSDLSDIHLQPCMALLPNRYFQKQQNFSVFTINTLMNTVDQSKLPYPAYRISTTVD